MPSKIGNGHVTAAQLASEEQEIAELALAERFRVGARVRIVDSDLAQYVGLTGTVLDYDFSGFSAGDPPLIGVLFDAPVLRVDLPSGSRPSTRDGFYDDELVLLTHVERCAACPRDESCTTGIK